MAIDAGTIAQLMSAMSPQARMQQYVQSLASGQDAQGGRTGPGVSPGGQVDPGYGNITFKPVGDAGFNNIQPNALPGENYTPPMWGGQGVGGGGGGGGGGGTNAQRNFGDFVRNAIMRRIAGGMESNAGPTSRVDPFNPYGMGSHWREDTSMPSQAGPDIPSAMAQEQLIAGQGRQTSNSPVPPQALQDYLRQAVLSQLGKLPMGMGR